LIADSANQWCQVEAKRYFSADATHDVTPLKLFFIKFLSEILHFLQGKLIA
jgi:hypothetical protein